MPKSHLGSFFSSEKLINWMRYLPEDRKLCEIRMPGSHDAALTTNTASGVRKGLGAPGSITICQSFGIKRQCEVGSRFFDLRFMKFRDTIRGFHAPGDSRLVTILAGNLGESLDDILDDVFKFLNENPSEFVIFRITHTDKSTGVVGAIKSHPVNKILYRSAGSENVAQTKISDLKGKLLILLDNKEFKADISQREGLHAHIKYSSLEDERTGSVSRIVKGLAICGAYSDKSDISKMVKKQEKRVDSHALHTHGPAHLFMYYYTLTGLSNIKTRALRPIPSPGDFKGTISSGGTHDPLNIDALRGMLNELESNQCGANVVLIDFVEELICWEIVKDQLMLHRMTEV